MTFVFRCAEHGDQVHASRNPKVCWCGQRLVRVYVMPNIAASALPSKGAAVSSISAREKRVDKDRDAYKRLRNEGMQPKSIDGAHHLENGANTKTEVEMGKLMPLSKVREGAERSSEVLGQNISA